MNDILTHREHGVLYEKPPSPSVAPLTSFGIYFVKLNPSIAIRHLTDPLCYFSYRLQFIHLSLLPALFFFGTLYLDRVEMAERKRANLNNWKADDCGVDRAKRIQLDVRENRVVEGSSVTSHRLPNGGDSKGQPLGNDGSGGLLEGLDLMEEMDNPESMEHFKFEQRQRRKLAKLSGPVIEDTSG